MKLTLRLNQDRKGGNHGWLKTFHSFAFASYAPGYQHNRWGPLRVLNEDRVEANTGFGLHSHAEFQIFSYVISGELEHHDSMNNVEILKRGDIQLTQAGTGIRHSESAHGPTQVHFLQVWAEPSVAGLSPKYFTRHFTDEEKRNKWARIVAPVDAEGVIVQREAPGPTPIHSALTVYATLLSPITTLSHTLPPSKDNKAKAYVHLVQSSGYNQGAAKGAHVRVSGSGAAVELKEGDGAYVEAEAREEVHVENLGDLTAELLLFDVGDSGVGLLGGGGDDEDDDQ